MRGDNHVKRQSDLSFDAKAASRELRDQREPSDEEIEQFARAEEIGHVMMETTYAKDRRSPSDSSNPLACGEHCLGMRRT